MNLDAYEYHLVGSTPRGTNSEHVDGKLSPASYYVLYLTCVSTWNKSLDSAKKHWTGSTGSPLGRFVNIGLVKGKKLLPDRLVTYDPYNDYIWEKKKKEKISNLEQS